ncbi:hypothetical protein [uncultured Kordia sp.]|uniref:hypothetical protein n=1 Tax=uncultured Kordia sp. TaxID=507699 RepID=UPI002629986A|nr:hypothetical protein [uncultured Kordia sp.]
MTKNTSLYTSHCILFIFSLVLASFFFSCGSSPEQELQKKINIAIRNDDKVDKQEWDDFTNHIKENEENFPELIDDKNEINIETLQDLIVERVNKRSNSQNIEIYNPNKIKEDEKAIDTKINFYIENSGSMNGYVRGITDFEVNLGKLLVLSKNYASENKIHINFINSEIHPIPETQDLIEFAESLEPINTSPYYKLGGSYSDRKTSVLNDILKKILDNTNENSISIFVSDCIYSLGYSKDAKGALGYQQNGTMAAYLEKFREKKDLNIVTAIYKINSDFNGKYFPYTYKGSEKNYVILDGQKRPYYIWILGDNKRVDSFVEKINFKDFIGYENSYFIANINSKKQPFFTVLKETNKLGDFKQGDRTSRNIKSIDGVKYEKGVLQFSIAIDLSKVPVDRNYLENKENYKINEGFFIKSIETVNRDKITRRDFLTVEKTTATHIITVSTTNKYSIRNLQLELLNKIPSWVAESSSVDDRNIKRELNKTFGLSYLINGVTDAYNEKNSSNNTSYFNIDINIKK